MLCDKDLRLIVNICFHDNSSTPLSNKALVSLTFNQTVYLTKASPYLASGILITFVNTYRFNLVVMFVCPVK